MKIEINSNLKYVLALSGGVDSVVLFYLLIANKINFRCIHVNHNISKFSESWESFCRVISKNKNIDFISKHVEVNSSNIEAVARKLRYEAIASEMTKDEILLTAHHMDDKLETSLFQMIRGCGLKGFSSFNDIATMDVNHRLIKIQRPLINYNKSAIESYAYENNLMHIVDDSNLNDYYGRNFIRNKIVPLLHNKFPSFKVSLNKFIKRVNEANQFMEEVYRDDYHRYYVNKSFFNQTVFFSFDVKCISELGPLRFNNLLINFCREHLNVNLTETSVNEIQKQLLHIKSKRLTHEFVVCGIKVSTTSPFITFSKIIST